MILSYRVRAAGAAFLTLGVVGLCPGTRAWAAIEELMVPNGSFEKPATPFVSLLFESWQRTPKPAGYVEEGGFQWNQLTGIFVNTAPGAADHIADLDGRQAAWLFAVPQAGLFQPVLTPDGSAGAVFEAGRAYRLSLDVIGAGGNMLDGAPLEVSLYWTDGAGQRVPMATLGITNSAAAFGARDRVVPFQLTTALVKPTDPWASKAMGVQVISTVSAEAQGGYWDIDRVRVEVISFAQPELTVLTEPGGLRLKWVSETGWRYRLRASTSLENWSGLGEPLAGSGGELTVLVPFTAEGSRFYSLTAESAD